MKVTAHYGNFFIRSTDLLALPSVDADKAFAAQFAHTDSTVPSKYVTIQSALLYTTSGGERRIRVFTQCLPVTNSLPELFKLADVDAVTAITAKMGMCKFRNKRLTCTAIEKALSSKLSDAREALVNKCIDIMAVYRSDVVGSAGGNNLLLPEALKLFPLFVLALVKNVIFRAGSDIKPDERTFYMMLARMFPASQLLRFIYPRLFALHQLPPEVFNYFVVNLTLKRLAQKMPMNL
jgi:protein transport protein SEC24